MEVWQTNCLCGSTTFLSCFLFVCFVIVCCHDSSHDLSSHELPYFTYLGSIQYVHKQYSEDKVVCITPDIHIQYSTRVKCFSWKAVIESHHVLFLPLTVSPLFQESISSESVTRFALESFPVIFRTSCGRMCVYVSVYVCERECVCFSCFLHIRISI